MALDGTTFDESNQDPNALNLEPSTLSPNQDITPGSPGTDPLNVDTTTISEDTNASMKPDPINVNITTINPEINPAGEGIDSTNPSISGISSLPAELQLLIFGLAGPKGFGVLNQTSKEVNRFVKLYVSALVTSENIVDILGRPLDKSIASQTNQVLSAWADNKYTLKPIPSDITGIVNRFDGIISQYPLDNRDFCIAIDAMAAETAPENDENQKFRRYIAALLVMGRLVDKSNNVLASSVSVKDVIKAISNQQVTWQAPGNTNTSEPGSKKQRVL